MKTMLKKFIWLNVTTVFFLITTALSVIDIFLLLPVAIVRGLVIMLKDRGKGLVYNEYLMNAIRYKFSKRFLKDYVDMIDDFYQLI